jgi:uncharacterized membrane protein
VRSCRGQLRGTVARRCALGFGHFFFFSSPSRATQEILSSTTDGFGLRFPLPLGGWLSVVTGCYLHTRTTLTTCASPSKTPNLPPPPPKKQIRAPLYIRFLCLIPYLIPMMSAIAFTGRAFTVYPLTFKIAITVSPLLQIFYSNSFLPFATFFAIFLGIVRNIKLNHFLRYNAMQAILLDICVMLAGLILSYVPIFLVVTPIGSFLEQMVLCNALFAVGYCMFHCVRGCYPEVPILQEAVYAQVRDVN